MREFFGCHELSEAVINSNLIVLKQVQALSFSSLLWEILSVFFEPNHVLIESPALISVERNLKFKFQVIRLLLLLWCGQQSCLIGASCCSASLLFVKLIGVGDKLLMLMVFIVEIGLCCYTMKVQIFSKSHFFKWERTV